MGKTVIIWRGGPLGMWNLLCMNPRRHCYPPLPLVGKKAVIKVKASQET